MEDFTDIDFVWILVSADQDAHNGESKRYALVEYIEDYDSLSLSKFTNTKLSWTKINDFNIYQNKRLVELLKEKKFLCKVGYDTYGYISGITKEIHSFSNENNDNIKNKLQNLVFDECVL